MFEKIKNIFKKEKKMERRIKTEQETKSEVITFAGQQVDKKIFENWFYEKGSRPEILINGELYMPILESDPDEYGMHTRWAWHPKYLVLKWINDK